MRSAIPTLLTSFLLACSTPVAETSGRAAETTTPVSGTVTSADGVEIAYTAVGSGEPALLFIHCGFCDQGFWRNQVDALADSHRVVTLDLAGHGASGLDRDEWTLRAFGEDVRAVADHLGLERLVLVGNSLGGPVSLAAAVLMPDRVVGVIAVDTLHDATAEWNQEAWRERVDSFRNDYAATCQAMIDSLFHPDADPELEAWVHAEMCDAGGELTASVLEIFSNYDRAAAMAAVEVPIRAINGDLYPTNIQGNREVAPGFAAVVLEGIGHFPQLEAPESFNDSLVSVVAELAAGSSPSP